LISIYSAEFGEVWCGFEEFFGFVIFSLGFVAEDFCAGFSQERRETRARACTQRREQGGGEERKRRGI